MFVCLFVGLRVGWLVGEVPATPAMLLLREDRESNKNKRERAMAGHRGRLNLFAEQYDLPL